MVTPHYDALTLGRERPGRGRPQPRRLAPLLPLKLADTPFPDAKAPRAGRAAPRLPHASARPKRAGESGPPMKMVVAIIKPYKIDDVRDALVAAGVEGMT